MSTDASSARFARQRILSGFGIVKQQKLAAAPVVVIGAGGLGSAILPMRAASGVGTITVVTRDADVIVDASDTLPTRSLANDTAAALGIPLDGGIDAWSRRLAPTVGRY